VPLDKRSQVKTKRHRVGIGLVATVLDPLGYDRLANTRIGNHGRKAKVDNLTALVSNDGTIEGNVVDLCMDFEGIVERPHFI